MSLSVNYTRNIGLHGVDPINITKNLIEWVNSSNDITVTGITNFNNDIKLSFDDLNFLKVSVDSSSNTTLNITNKDNDQTSEFIFNNKINANEGMTINKGLTITGDTIIGEDSTDTLIINNDMIINSSTKILDRLVIPVVSTRPTNPENGTIIINSSTGHRIEIYSGGWKKADGTSV